MSDKKFNVIGQPLRKVDAAAKVTGRTVFADDIVLPQMLHAKILRSSRPHAKILAIDTSAAEVMEGVKAILLGHELPITFGILPVSQDEHTLAVDTVRYVGDPVAAVAAVDEETAEAATRRIKVEYEDLSPIMSIPDGLRQTDTNAALANADLTLEDIFFYQGSQHLPMEQHAAVASYQSDGKLILW